MFNTENGIDLILQVYMFLSSLVSGVHKGQVFNYSF